MANNFPTVLPRIVLTTGEPAGIGPEISIRAAWQLRSKMKITLVGDAEHLIQLAAQIDPEIVCAILDPSFLKNVNHSPFSINSLDCLGILNCPLAVSSQSGRLNALNSQSVLNTLDVGIVGIQAGWFDAMVTAPVHKSVMNEAGIFFTGHTEYLAQNTDSDHVVMLLASSVLRVALATTHIPLAAVPKAITRTLLLSTLNLIEQNLKEKWKIAVPRIVVSGLNPHAGEGGYLGSEEIDVIIPAIEAAQAKGMMVSGPYPADTLFQPKYLEQADCVLAMYHDQGLPVLKYASFGSAVNVTLGLPFVRTSVDHGTALDIAALGIGHADYGSMVAALEMAASMVGNS